MEPLYVLVTVLFDGRVRVARTTSPEIPEFATPPGGVCFIVHAVDFSARHYHGIDQESRFS